MKEELFVVLLIGILCCAFGVILGSHFAVAGVAQDCQKLGAFHSERVVYDCKERK